MTHLLGVHAGRLAGMEFFFTTTKYAKKYLKEIPIFYREAILTMTKLPFRKQLIDLRQEKIFFNPIFTTEMEEVLQTTPQNPYPNYYTYGTLLDEHNLRQNNQAYRKRITQVFDKIKNIDSEDRDEFSLRYNSTDLTFDKITLKILYKEILKIDFYKAHHSLFKWTEEMQHTAIDWDQVWKSLHNPLALEETKTVIWEQLHLNAYNTFSYNKWWNSRKVCPLCLIIPESEYHLIFNCQTTKELWEDLKPFLKQIDGREVTKEEMAFGASGNTAKINLRNWLTFLLRECISEQERIAYKNNQGLLNKREIKITYNVKLKEQILTTYRYHEQNNTMQFFKLMYCADGTFLEYDENIEHFTLPNIFPHL